MPLTRAPIRMAVQPEKSHPPVSKGPPLALLFLLRALYLFIIVKYSSSSRDHQIHDGLPLEHTKLSLPERAGNIHYLPNCAPTGRLRHHTFAILLVGRSNLEHLVEALERAGRRYSLSPRRLGAKDLPAEAIDPKRGQARADDLLKHFSQTERLPEGSLGLILTDYDIFASTTNFLFGLAERRLGWAVVSTYRLGDRSKPVFATRVEKEIVHELGHLLGLAHCTTSKCVMSFSNTMAEVDAKTPDLCNRCLSILSTAI